MLKSLFKKAQTAAGKFIPTLAGTTTPTAPTTLTPAEMTDEQLKVLWMDNFRNDPDQLQIEELRWTSRDLTALRDDLEDAYLESLEDDEDKLDDNGNPL